MAAANEALEECRAIDAETTEAETAIAEATAAISGKDYRLALEKATEAKERAKKAYGERVVAIVDSSAGLLNIAKNMGANVVDGEAAIEKSRDALTKEDYATALDLAKRIWKKFEKIVHEHLSKSFSAAQALIMTAKNIGKDTATVEDLLSRARGAVESNDFELALSYTNECLEAIRGELTEEVTNATAEVEALIKTSQEQGVDVSKMTALIERSKADAQKLEFQKALNALKQSKSEGEKTLQKGLDLKIAEALKLVDTATEMGADAGNARNIIEQANSSLKEGSFQQAANLTKQAFQEIQAAQFQRVLFTIAQSRDKFVAAKNIGADITPAMDVLNKARMSLQQGRFKEALDFAKNAEDEVEKSLQQFRQVETTVKDISSDFIEAESLGVNVASARRFLERAKKDLNARDFASALEEVRKAKEDLARSEYERTMEVMEQSEVIMTLGERMGADLEDAGRFLEDCIVATKDKQYRKAIELAQGASSSAEISIKGKLTDALANMRGSMGFLAEDAANLRSLVDKAEGAMAARDYDGAFTFVTEGQKLIEGRTKAKADEFHQLLKSAVELGAELGAPVGALAELFKEADSALERGDLAKVISMREQGIADLGAIGETIFNIVKERIVEARNFRINIEELLQLLKRARMALSVGELPEAFRLMSECSQRTAMLISMHKETYNAISSAAALVAEAKKKDVDVTAVLEMLLEAKRAFERLDYERALELARKSKSETEKLMTLYSSAQNIIATKEKLAVAESLDIDTAVVRDNLERAKEAMKNKSYDEAFNVSAKTLQIMDEMLDHKIRGFLSQADSILDTLKDAQMTEQREKLERAKEHLERREWSEAGSLAMAVRDDLERSIKKKEESAIALKNCQDALSEIEALNIETPDARKLIEKAERAAKAGDFEAALEAAISAKQEIERERDASVNKTIDKFQDAINKAKREGIDTRSAEKLLEKARQQFRDGRYRQALSLAMQSEAEAERIGLQQDMAAKAIMTAEKKLKGFGSPMPEVSNLITGAQRAFEDGDYVKALDLAIRAGDGFNKYRELLEDMQDIKAKAEKLTRTAFQIGADAAKLDKILSEANAASDAGDPKSARDAYQQCVDWGLGLCRSHLGKQHAQAAEFAADLKVLNLDPLSVAKKLSEAKAHIDSENFESAFALIHEAKKEAQDQITRAVGDILSASEAAIAHARKINADVAEAEQLLADGRKAMEAGQYEKAMRLAKDSVSRVEARREFEKKFVDFSFKADSTIRNARKYGIDVNEAEKILAEALKVKKTDLDKAIELAEKSHKKAMDAVEAFAPKMEVQLEVPGAVLGQWIDGTITLVNVGKALAKDVKVKILGDVEVQGTLDAASVRAKGEVKLPLKAKMGASGSIPLSVNIVSHRLFDGKEYAQEIIAQVEVADKAAAAQKPPEEPKPAAPPQPLIAANEGRCLICKGSIKVGFRIARCQSCGKEFHEMCAARARTCPSCQKPLAG